MTSQQTPASVASFDAGRARLTLSIAGLAAMATYLDTTILFVAGFNRIWWLVVIGGIATTLCALPLRTNRAS
jgi:hypothetical protein